MTSHEQFIELSTARLAKQAGFDWEVYCNYVGDDHKLCRLSVPFNTNVSKSNLFSAPTQAVLQRWLREVKQIDVQAEYVRGADIDSNLAPWSCSYEDLTQDPRDRYSAMPYIYHSYEAALEAGLQKCLTLLIENKL